MRWPSRPYCATGRCATARLTYQLAYINALTTGKAGFEINPGLQAEVDALWAEVRRMAFSTAPLSIRRRAAAND